MCVTYQDDCITVSSHFPTMSVTYQANFVKGYDREKKEGGREKRKKGGNSDNYDVAIRPSNGNRLQSCYLCLFSHSGCDISQELYHFIIPFSDNTHDISNKPTDIVDCVQIIFSYFPLQLNIMFSFSNQSLEVSIETIKK